MSNPQTSRRLVIGVDGGGTKTLGAIMDSEGNLLARELFPSSNPHAASADVVRDVLTTLVESLCQRAGISPAEIAAICLGMAGCDSDAEREHIEELIRPAVPDDCRLIVVNDAVIAMVALLGRLHGMLVIAGTGSICIGYNEHTGDSTRCGGWGHLLADEGAGYQIGLSALRAILKELDGRGPKTSLSKTILDHLELSEPRDILTWLYRETAGKASVAALSRFVMAADEDGDEAAASILDKQAAALAGLVKPVYDRLFHDESKPVQIGLWGGNLVHAANYRRRFEECLNSTGLRLEIVFSPEADAVLGATQHALNSIG
ncbi:ROK family protein [bacterium]|nr:ROK family protein [bacterium]